MFGLLQLELPFFASLRDTRKTGQSPAAPPPPEEPHEIILHGQPVPYVVRRSARRRTLGLTIDTRGLRVAAPVKARHADIERLINSNARWVLAKLREWQQPEHATARAWALGDPLLYLGSARALKVAPGKPGLAVFDDCLILTVPQPHNQSETRTRLRALIKEQARCHFALRLAHYSAQFGVEEPQLRLTRAATRWGSCARDRDGSHRISLNWRMVHLEPRLIDYVVAHEVAHMKHMHHGPRFWSAVAHLYPEYEAAREEMRRISLLLPEL